MPCLHIVSVVVSVVVTFCTAGARDKNAAPELKNEFVLRDPTRHIARLNVWGRQNFKVNSY